MNTETGRITKRLVMCLIAIGMIWFVQHVHREWVWYYFDCIMNIEQPSPDLTKVAEGSISSITTISIAAMSAVTAVVIFFVTGNVMALQSMFKFNALTQSTASVAAQTVSEHIEQRVVDERIVREMADKYAGDPSYRPLHTLPGEEGK